MIQLSLNHKFNTKFLVNSFAVFLFILIGFIPSSIAQKKQYVVVLDAGHGGKDPGSTGNGYREKVIALRVAKFIGTQLQKRKDIKTLYTRSKDVFIDLWKRGEIANKAKADLFVSIHCNSHNSKASGTESFVLSLDGNKQNFEVAKKENAVILLEDNHKERYKGFDPNSPESVIGLTLEQEENLEKSLSLAGSVQKNFRANLKRKDRGVKQAGFVVLYQTYMPSILVELGFLTNKNEGRYLNSKKGQLQMANSIANAITKYIDSLKLNTIQIEDDELAIQEVKDLEIDKKRKKVVFKIQIASSKKRIRTKSYNFKGLKNVQRVKTGKHYKYYYGITSNYKEAKSSFEKVKKKGYSTAFIVVFRAGKKITLAEALK